MNEKNTDFTSKKLLYDPMFDPEMKKAAQARAHKTRNKILFAVIIVCFIFISLYFSFRSINQDKYNYDINDEGLLMLTQFNGQDTDTVLYVDFQRDVNGNNPDAAKPIEAVKDYAVNCNEYLRYIYISKNVTSLDSISFYYCKNLYGIFVEEGNPNYTSIDGILYQLTDGLPKKVILSPSGRGYALCAQSLGAKLPACIDEVTDFLEYCTANKDKIDKAYEEFRYSLTLPQSVTDIGQLAFAYNEKLEHITLHEGIETVETMAFFRCGQIKALDFPSTLETIGSDGFSYLGEVTYIYIPSNITHIGHHAFYGCGAQQINMELTEEEAEEKVFFGDSWTPKTRKVFEKSVPVLYNCEKEVK